MRMVLRLIRMIFSLLIKISPSFVSANSISIQRKSLANELITTRGTNPSSGDISSHSLLWEAVKPGRFLYSYRIDFPSCFGKEDVYAAAGGRTINAGLDGGKAQSKPGKLSRSPFPALPCPTRLTTGLKRRPSEIAAEECLFRWITEELGLVFKRAS